MAANFGEKLLGEVTEVRLDEILHDLRNICADESSNRLGVKALDDLLEVFMPVPIPSQQQHPEENSNLRPDERQAHHRARARPDPVVEISSTSSAAGKSQLLYYLTAIAVLPATIDDVQIDGRNAAVVFVDADGRFDADRLLSVARDIIQQKLKQQLVEQPDIETILYNSLQHVHVFRPTSSASFLATLQSLQSYLFDLTRHLSTNRPLHGILVDSATAFLWQDKLRDQVARVEEIGRPHAEIEYARRSKSSFYIADMYAELVRALKRVQSVFGCAVVYTTTAWVGRAASVSGDELVAFRCPLPPPWGLFPTLRVVLRTNGQGRFLGCVNGLGREEWSRRVVEELERRGRGFVFDADREGVHI